MYLYNGFRWLAPRGLHGDEARGLVSRLLDEARSPDVSGLLHYQTDAQGRSQTREGLPLVRFLGKKDGFALLGMGEEGARLVMALSPTIALSVARAMQRPVMQNMREGSCRMEPLPYAKSYRIPRVVVQKKPRHMKAWQADPQGFLAALIERGLRDQAALLGLSAPDDLGIEVESFEHGTPVPIGHDSGGFCATARNVSFRAKIDLEGYWAVGHLRARGYGHFLAHRPVEAGHASE